MADIKKIKVNKPLKTFKAGQVIEVDFDNYQDRIYWKRRLEDAKIDGCCELIAEDKKEDKAEDKKEDKATKK